MSDCLCGSVLKSLKDGGSCFETFGKTNNNKISSNLLGNASCLKICSPITFIFKT